MNNKFTERAKDIELHNRRASHHVRTSFNASEPGNANDVNSERAMYPELHSA